MGFGHGRGGTSSRDVRRELALRCQRFLQPGEVVRYVFPGRVGLLVTHPSAWLFQPLFMSPFERRVICITDRAILIMACRRGEEPSVVLTRLPREIRLGADSDTWASLKGLGGGIYVHKDFQGDVAAADAELERT